ncbi:hypothetical protein L7F22_048500 [Adiantum nelumboides]|nr:hypothetical protein [Adiantum nelumboides]
MEVGSVSSGMALRFAKPSAGPRLPQPWAKPFRHLQLYHMPSCRCPSSSLCSAAVPSCRCPSSSLCSAAVRAYQRPQPAACEDIETPTDGTREIEALMPSVISSEHKALLALILSLGFAFGSAGVALALGPEGPLVEEFWDNVRRYGLYFLTVFTGGLYSLLQPIFSLLRNPLTAIFTIAFLSGTFYLLYLVLNTMLGITAFNYNYA